MKFEVLSRLVLRLVVGSFLLLHSIYMFIIYALFESQVDFYLSSLGFFVNDFFLVAIPLFLIIETVVSILLLLDVWVERLLLVAFSIIAVLGTVLFLINEIVMLSAMTVILGALVILFRVFSSSEDFKALNSYYVNKKYL
ncbi:MAG: hypothetical protein ACJAZZ_001564 [Dokdonia donghaensis]|jgi:hypothetical protein